MIVHFLSFNDKKFNLLNWVGMKQKTTHVSAHEIKKKFTNYDFGTRTVDG